MTATTKECLSCKKTLDESDFRKGRNVCMACKAHQHETQGFTVPMKVTCVTYIPRASLLLNLARRASITLTFDIEPEDLISLWEKQDGKCAVSGVYLTHHKDGSGYKEYNASIDRITGDKGYTIHNVQLVAYRINIMKHTLSEDMFYWWVKTINDFSCD